MKILETLKQIFPKPQLPQKRYIFIGLIIYFGLKFFVALTPTEADDSLPDEIREAIILHLAQYEPKYDE